MKYFKDLSNRTWAFAVDGSQDALIAAAIANGMAPLSEAELLNHRHPPPDPAAQAATELRALESQITPLMLAEALITGDTAPLRTAYQKVKDAKGKIK